MPNPAADGAVKGGKNRCGRKRGLSGGLNHNFQYKNGDTKVSYKFHRIFKKWQVLQR